MGVSAVLGGGASYLLAKSVIEATRITVLDMCETLGRKNDATDHLESDVVE